MGSPEAWASDSAPLQKTGAEAVDTCAGSCFGSLILINGVAAMPTQKEKVIHFLELFANERACASCYMWYYQDYLTRCGFPNALNPNPNLETLVFFNIRSSLQGRKDPDFQDEQRLQM